MNTNAARNDWLMTTCLAELAATWQIINAIRERTIDTRVCLSVAWLLAAFVWTSETTAAEPLQVDFAGLADEYQEEIRPLMHQFCLGCHSSEKREGELDLEQFTTLTQVRRGTQAWLKVVEMLAAGEMPPGEAKQPPPEQRKQLRGWVERYLHAEALAGAGDPGPVVLRRLNNAEYTWTIRDLTGVNLSPAREFPTDSAAGEGFTNTGAALVMSPALLSKYLDAGKQIASHAVLLPDGFRFSMQATRRDWTDEILAQLREFYRQSVTTTDFGVGSEVGNVNVHGNTRIGLAGRLPLEEYLAATLAERDALNTGEKTVESVASERGLNARYLGTLWSSLLNTDPSLLLDGLRSRWRSAKAEDAAALAAEVAAWQKGLWTFGPVGLIGRTGGPARWMESVNPLVTQDELRFTIPAPKNDAAPKDDEEAKDDEDANDVDPSRKDVEFSLMVTDAGDGNEHDYVVFQRPRLAAEGKPDVLLRDIEGTGLDPTMFGMHPQGHAIDAASLCVQAPTTIKVRLSADVAAGREFITTATLEKESALEGSAQVLLLVRDIHHAPTIRSGLFASEVTTTFSRVEHLFSDHRDVSYRGPFLVSEKGTARARIESAIEAHRSLFPAALCFTQIVPVDEVLTLQMFYREDDHLIRLMLDDAGKTRLDRLWEELEYVSQSPLLRANAMELLLEVMQDSPQYEGVKPLRKPLEEQAAAFRKRLIGDEPNQVAAMVDFAARAWRRLLTDAEAGRLRGLYHRLRDQELPHDDAFRLTLARILVASPFLYRLENAPVGTAAAPVSDWELASRLSYFLWSSLPDDELRQSATAGRLAGSGRQGRSGMDHDESLAAGSRSDEELLRQTRRMLGDPRVRRLAAEFACQWLHIHDFALLEEKSEKHFPEFAELRDDMYEESILFFTDLFQNDRSLLSLLDADHTFVNQRLASFYGIEGIEGAAWRRTEGIRQHGRGGILGLATTLAKQSGASRTSPILRGNWISEVLLGEKLPRPPQEVPQLPADETATDGLTLRQLVARHTSDARCSSCHQRIDPFGFALEGFDAIGRRRDHDMAGRPIDTKTTLPDGTQINGLTDLRDYLLTARRDAFLDQFCRKLLGYAIGREVRLSDKPLVTEILERLAENDYRFSVAVETIVLSQQFQMIRGREMTKP